MSKRTIALLVLAGALLALYGVWWALSRRRKFDASNPADQKAANDYFNMLGTLGIDVPNPLGG